MKVSSEELAKSYKDYLAKSTSNEEPCPLPESIVRCLRSDVSKKDRKEILDHISNCLQCSDKVKFVLEIMSKEPNFIGELKTHFKSNDKQIPMNEAYKNKRNILRPVYIGSTILLISIISIYFVIRHMSIPDYRRSPTGSLNLIFPKDRAISINQLKFKWQVSSKAKYYIVEVFDASLNLLWKSNAITTNELSLPEEITMKLDSSDSCFWAVTAYLENGNKIKSKLAEFHIAK